MNALKAYLIEKFNLPAKADKKAVRQLAAEKLASGELSQKKYLKLTTAKADRCSPIEKLAGCTDPALKKRVEVPEPPRIPANPTTAIGTPARLDPATDAAQPLADLANPTT